jgi:hypothetical protein
MNKKFLYSFVGFFPVLLLSCGVFTKNSNSNYTTNSGTRSSATAQKTEIVKDKDLKGTQFNAVDEQGRKLNFQIKDVELDPKDSEKETYLYTDGATFINRPRWFETVSEIRQECPNKLKGRINEDGDWTTAQKAKQNLPNSLLFNDSIVRKRD